MIVFRAGEVIGTFNVDELMRSAWEEDRETIRRSIERRGEDVPLDGLAVPAPYRPQPLLADLTITVVALRGRDVRRLERARDEALGDEEKPTDRLVDVSRDIIEATVESIRGVATRDGVPVDLCRPWSKEKLDVVEDVGIIEQLARTTLKLQGLSEIARGNSGASQRVDQATTSAAHALSPDETHGDASAKAPSNISSDIGTALGSALSASPSANRGPSMLSASAAERAQTSR